MTKFFNIVQNVVCNTVFCLFLCSLTETTYLVCTQCVQQYTNPCKTCKRNKIHIMFNRLEFLVTYVKIPSAPQNVITLTCRSIMGYHKQS